MSVGPIRPDGIVEGGPDATVFDLLDADIDVDAYLDDLQKGREVDPPRRDDGYTRELIVEPTTGTIRQAGATGGQSAEWITKVRTRFERSLFSFVKGVLKRTYLTKTLHRPVCRWLQAVPPTRKLCLLPREHAKTTIVSHGLPVHLQIQSAESNPYMPGVGGEDIRIILSGEAERRVKDHLRVIETAFEGNAVLRALWPHRTWENPARQSKKWNDVEMILPRSTEYPDPSVRVVGVGGAITGAHPNVLIKDDLVTFKAANSPLVMQEAIQWHIASRALINEAHALEFIVGTRWAVHDLYHEILTNDPSVASMTRAVIEGGRPIYPERFTLDKIEQLRREFGTLFPLLYMNEAADPALVDFDMTLVRGCQIVGNAILFEEDIRDSLLAFEEPDRAEPRGKAAERLSQRFRGRPLDSETYEEVCGREAWLRTQYAQPDRAGNVRLRLR